MGMRSDCKTDTKDLYKTVQSERKPYLTGISSTTGCSNSMDLKREDGSPPMSMLSLDVINSGSPSPVPLSVANPLAAPHSGSIASTIASTLASKLSGSNNKDGLSQLHRHMAEMFEGKMYPDFRSKENEMPHSPSNGNIKMEEDSSFSTNSEDKKPENGFDMSSPSPTENKLSIKLNNTALDGDSASPQSSSGSDPNQTSGSPPPQSTEQNSSNTSNSPIPLDSSISGGDGNENTTTTTTTSSSSFVEVTSMAEDDRASNCSPLLNTPLVSFNLTAPTPMPPQLNVHYICESASRLLFLSIHWARNIPAFQSLVPFLQVELLRGSWSEILTLGLAQCSYTLSLNTILTVITQHLATSVESNKISQDRFKEVYKHIARLQDVTEALCQMRLDEHEYAYLKAMVLFSCDHIMPGQLSYSDKVQIQRGQRKASVELRQYHAKVNADPDRLSALLLILPSIRALQPQVMEELFFAGLIGNVQIDSVIPFIMKMEMSE